MWLTPTQTDGHGNYDHSAPANKAPFGEQDTAATRDILELLPVRRFGLFSAPHDSIVLQPPPPGDRKQSIQRAKDRSDKQELWGLRSEPQDYYTERK